VLPKIQDLSVKGKKVLLRADLDVPLENLEIIDDSRLNASLETIKYLKEKGASIIICGHKGRPNGKDETLSLRPIAKWFANYFNSKLTQQHINSFTGWNLEENIYLLENLRFDPGELENSPQFVSKLSEVAEIYCNDAFAVTHRNNASITGICTLLPHFAGLHLQKELSELESVFKDPQRPLAVIVGGAKIETKLPLIEKMCSIADYILVGGKIAEYYMELEKIKKVKKDAILLVGSLNEEETDITQASVDNFLQIIPLAKTIIWNGPLGLIRPKNQRDKSSDSEHSTTVIAQSVTESKAHTIVGGGDTLEYLHELKLLNKFSFVSTGGGAMLALLSGEKLPGIEALKKI